MATCFGNEAHTVVGVQRRSRQSAVILRINPPKPVTEFFEPSNKNHQIFTRRTTMITTMGKAVRLWTAITLLLPLLLLLHDYDNINSHTTFVSAMNHDSTVAHDDTSNHHNVVRDDILRDGSAQFQNGIRLFQQDQLEEAAVAFWNALMLYESSSSSSSSNKQSYSAKDALVNFLFCHEQMGQAALGYARVAATMYRTGDERSIVFLRKAYEQDPENDSVRELMNVMGETPETLLSDQRYSDESDDDDESDDRHVSLPESCNTQHDCVKALEVQGRTVVVVSNSNKNNNNNNKNNNNNNSTDNNTDYSIVRTKYLDSGWDEATRQRRKAFQQHLEQQPTLSITIPPLLHHSLSVVLSNNAHTKFWQHIHEWEQSTFAILSRYIDDDTIVVDIGTWIGPTMLYHAQLSRRSYGIEADPMAHQEFVYNMNLNPSNNNMWLEGVAVTAPQDVGVLNVQSQNLGNSQILLGTNQNSDATTGQNPAGSNKSVMVRGYTLPYILAHWDVHVMTDKIFLKMDIESYECRLVPTFHEWLQTAAQLAHRHDESNNNNNNNIHNTHFHETRTVAPILTILVSFHPQIRPCTKEQMRGVLETMKLFQYVSCNQDNHVLPIRRQTTLEDLEGMLDDAGCLSDEANSDFVLRGLLETSGRVTI